MQIKVSARHGHLGENTREKILGKVEKLSRYFDRLTSIEVIVDLQDELAPAVELSVSAEHKHDFRAVEQSDNLLAAVESVVHKMEQQLKRYKDRLQDHRKPSFGFVEERPPERSPGAPEADEAETE